MKESTGASLIFHKENATALTEVCGVPALIGEHSEHELEHAAEEKVGEEGEKEDGEEAETSRQEEDEAPFQSDLYVVLPP